MLFWRLTAYIINAQPRYSTKMVIVIIFIDCLLELKTPRTKALFTLDIGIEICDYRHIITMQAKLAAYNMVK